MDGYYNKGPANKPTRPKRRFQFKRPSPFVFMILSAALFLIGSASFNGHGSRQMAEIGVGGAVIAIAMIVGFIL